MNDPTKYPKWVCKKCGKTNRDTGAKKGSRPRGCRVPYVGNSAATA